MRRLILLGLSLALVVGTARAYNLSGSQWTTVPVTMHLQLGSSYGTLIDGNSSWDASAEDALATWNSVLTKYQFNVVRNSTALIQRGNRINNVCFASTIYGSSFDSRTLAVTLTSSSSGAYVEADVLFNINLSWNSYRGNLRYNGYTSLNDLHRVAIHEFGHVLGLNHPDDIGQVVSAVMNSSASDIDNLMLDDINGARAIYDGFTVTAPVITSQPETRSVMLGTNTTFTVVASGTAPLTYQWRKNGSSISGATSSSYSIYSIAASDAGNYSVTVTNSAGSVTSSTATLTVSGAGPTITTQPSATSVSAGNSASFMVVASGTGPLSYQWRKDGSSISGATSSTYTIISTKTTDAGSYTVVVSNSYGSITSNAATLTIVSIPVVNIQPTSLSVNVGSPVAFYSTVSGSSPLTYQWRKDGAPIAGATNASFTILAAKTTDAGNYTLTVSNSAGNATSNAAQLTVNELAPTILAPPSSSTVVVGSSATFTVSVTSSLPLTYQWKKEGVAINGATSSAYTIVTTKTTDAGSYTVVVTNSVGSVTSSAATLTITAPRLSNLSVRTALDANQIVIVGFTMAGGAKSVLLRAAGPTLSAFGVPSVMADPKLELYSGSTKVTTNDNWGGSSSLSAVFQSVGAFGYSSTTSLDAALVASIDGGRTVQVSGLTAGTVLVEGYDAGSGDAQRFSNLSARNKVGTGGNILIAGFTLTGSGTRNLLIRAVGPTLTNFGVPDVLADPKLEIYSGTTKVTENDNWSSALSPTFASVGAFGLTPGSKDAAITVSLPAGGYTVQVSGADGGVGEAIVEIYELP